MNRTMKAIYIVPLKRLSLIVCIYGYKLVNLPKLMCLGDKKISVQQENHVIHQKKNEAGNEN